MSKTKRLPKKIRDTQWQSLGEIKLPAGPARAAGRIITAWLRECTKPLNLCTEFREKITKFALEASSRALKAGHNPRDIPYVVLCIYAPLETLSTPDRKFTWSFFSIEKKEGSSKDKLAASNSIELYLYPESN